MKTLAILGLLLAGCGARPYYGPGQAVVDQPTGPTEVTTDLRVVGTWTNGAATLAIHDSGIYSLTTSDAKVGGSWTADGETLTLTNLFPSAFHYTIDGSSLAFNGAAWSRLGD